MFFGKKNSTSNKLKTNNFMSNVKELKINKFNRMLHLRYPRYTPGCSSTIFMMDDSTLCCMSVQSLARYMGSFSFEM